MQASRQRVALVGAYDRFNYGDLLFPLITTRELAKRGIEVECRAYSLLDADLSSYGAIPNSNIRALYNRSFLRPGDVCIVNGGGTMGVDWTDIYSHTLGPRGNRALYLAERLVGRTRVDRAIRAYFGGRSITPFIPAAADFGMDVKVVYNACGGSEIAGLPDSLKLKAYAALKSCDYLSVRDKAVQDILLPHAPPSGVTLAPDSAVVMSTHFPLPHLLEKARAKVLDLLTEPYVCVQANIDFGQAHIEALSDLCDGVYKQHGLRAVLLPIGRYTGLDDGIYLRTLARTLKSPHALVPEDASILEIMLVIAKATLFLGTSLHGNITAQSFAVPHLGLNPKSPKLGAYLKSWDIPAFSDCIDMNQREKSLAAVAQAMAAPAADREAKRAELISAAQANFDRLFKAAGLMS